MAMDENRQRTDSLRTQQFILGSHDVFRVWGGPNTGRDKDTGYLLEKGRKLGRLRPPLSRRPRLDPGRRSIRYSTRMEATGEVVALIPNSDTEAVAQTTDVQANSG